MFLGLDLGTSGLKGVVIDDAGAIVSEATAPLTVQRPHPGWSEQNPAEWLSAAEAVMAQLGAALAAVRGIGLSGQMHGATLLDSAGDVLRSCMLWNDTRSHGEAAAFDADPIWRKASGNIVFPGFTAPKVAWVQRHEPDVFRKIAKILLPKDYLRLWLTGAAVSDLSDASGTSWLDPGTRDWSDTLLAASGLTRDHMPALVEGTAPSGTLRAELADRWGMRRDVVVAGGGGDNAASAIGMGVVNEGDAFVSLGTSGVLFVTNEAYRPSPDTAVHTFCHALPDRWHQMGVILSATDALNWYADLVGAKPADLTANLAELNAPGKTLFLPYLGGERTPINSASVRAAFLGLEHATDRDAATRAVLEGVTFALRACRDAIARTGTPVRRLIAVGGGSRSDYWLNAIATALQVPVMRTAAGDYGAAFGAARLGATAVTGSRDLLTQPEVARTFDPDVSLAGAFDQGFARYTQATTALLELT